MKVRPTMIQGTSYWHVNKTILYPVGYWSALREIKYNTKSVITLSDMVALTSRLADACLKVVRHSKGFNV